MKPNTLVLLIIVAITAVGLGVMMSRANTSSDISYPALLNANLVEASSVTAEPTSTTIGEKLGDLTVVNFWATWCAPCRHEMPMFQSIFAEMSNNEKSFVIVGVTIDSIEQAIPTLDSMGITYPIVYAELTGNELMASVGNPQGLLPYTLVLDANGQVVEQKIGRVNREDVQAWIDTYL